MFLVTSSVPINPLPSYRLITCHRVAGGPRPFGGRNMPPRLGSAPASSTCDLRGLGSWPTSDRTRSLVIFNRLSSLCLHLSCTLQSRGGCPAEESRSLKLKAVFSTTKVGIMCIKLLLCFSVVRQAKGGHKNWQSSWFLWITC